MRVFEVVYGYDTERFVDHYFVASARDEESALDKLKKTLPDHKRCRMYLINIKEK